MSDKDLMGLDTPQVWDTEHAFAHLSAIGKAETIRAAKQYLNELDILPTELAPERLEDELAGKPTPVVLNWEIEQARDKRQLVLFAQLHSLPSGKDCLHANDARGTRYWVPLTITPAGKKNVMGALQAIQHHIGKEIVIFPHGRLVPLCRELVGSSSVKLGMLSYAPRLEIKKQPGIAGKIHLSPYLKQLEAESIHIIREAVAEAENPVMLYSVGKDSSVMLHLARKAFYPAALPFPLLHVDTRWKFREMYLFRDRMARESGVKLLVHINPEAIEKNINPFEHGSVLHTHITKTEGLKQALDKYKFDVVFGGARRDEEKSRAKERIFSFRSKTHVWDPKNQRPELWNLYNTHKAKGESIRVFPLSNWTELDIWLYIHQQNLPVVPLYFARERPVVVREGMMMMVDDARLRLLPGEKIAKKNIRFRTLGCYPLTGAIESVAADVPQIILELINTRSSERQGRAIDSDASASMEKKKREGYF